MKRTVFTILLTLVMLSLIVSCAQPTTPATTSKPTATSTPTQTPTSTAVKAITLNYNKMGPATQRTSQAPAEYLASEVAKRTEGRVKIEIFPNSALASPDQTYDALLRGVSDIGESLASYTPGRFPATEISETPLGYPNSWVGAHAMNDWYNKFKPKEFDGAQMLYMFVTAPYVIGTVNKPVRKLEDLKGMIIRSSGAASDKYVQALGATPRAMAVTEVYEALSKAMLDGVLLPMEAYPAFKLDEVIKYVTDTSFSSYGNATYVAANKASFSKLSEKDQKLVLEVAQEIAEFRGTMFMEDTTKAINSFKTRQGREWINLTPDEVTKVKNAALAITEAWIKDKTAAGFPAQDYVNYMKERLAYWTEKQPK